MQLPTCPNLRVRNVNDAHVIFHAVSMNLLPMVTRRLDTDERRSITSGCVFVWEERGSNSEATGLGIERWTDSIRWGPSRVRDEFLFYHEKEGGPTDRDYPSGSNSSPSNNLVKQTYSVFVETPKGRRKWHLIAYFTQDTVDRLPTIDDFPELANIQVPPGKYKSARSAKNASRTQNYFELHPPTYGASEHGYYCPDPYAVVPPGYEDHRAYSGRSRDSGGVLAPLAYLQNIPPPRRHPVDEEALMSLRPVWAPL